MLVRILHYSVIFLDNLSFFSLILPKPTRSEAIKSLHAEKKLILVQKGLSSIFKSVPTDSGDIQ